MTDWKVIQGDCLEVLRTLPDCSVDAVVTDPPYGLSFMGKRWDYDVPSVEVWAECLRVLKPGGHLLAFAGTRTQHRMAVRIEDAGFEIRDMIAWVYGSGFPKSLDVSKAIDKAAGAEREKVRVAPRAVTSGTMAGSSDTRPWIEKSRELGYHEVAGPIPATEAASQWQGWGTALKPALEPITVARKPLEGTVAANVLRHGTGGLNIDGCRVGSETIKQHGRAASENRAMSGANYAEEAGRAWTGRWPANLIHDGSEEVVAGFPNTTSGTRNGIRKAHKEFGTFADRERDSGYFKEGDSGSAARFFYCAKASKRDRDEGLEGMAARLSRRYGEQGQGPSPQQTPRTEVEQRNHHPTVKPTDLMRYLCRLVTPSGGVVLDPFCGSGSTGKAAALEGFGFIGIEREAEYVEIARARIAAAVPAPVPADTEPPQLSLAL